MNFPFSKGETFIENEIPYLAESFDTVMILSLNARKNDVLTRPVPKNVIAVPLNNYRSKFRYFYYSIFGFFHSDKSEFQEACRQHSLMAAGATFYASGRFKSSLRKSVEIIEERIDWSRFKSCVFYSYWFMDQAMLAANLKNHYRGIVRCKSVSRAHGYDLYADRNRSGCIPFREETLRGLDAVFPCSEDGTQYLVEKYPAYQAKIKTAYLGTLDHGLQKNQPNLNEFHIVSCSNIIGIKRVDLIADAIGELILRGFRSIHWTCIGDGPMLDGLREHVRTLGIEKYVSFLGRLDNRQVIDFYKNNWVDLFVNVSSSEGLPVSIMEAQSFGIPCFATDVGGTKEIVDQSVGKLMDCDVDSFVLANAIKEFSSLTKQEVMVIRLNARLNWEQKFSARKNYLDWCENILGRYIGSRQV
jgi:glycosyltransferase involved in cell wall biosynthesis